MSPPLDELRRSGDVNRSGHLSRTPLVQMYWTPHEWMTYEGVATPLSATMTPSDVISNEPIKTKEETQGSLLSMSGKNRKISQ